MIPILDTESWIQRVQQQQRPKAEHLFAFYDHNIGAICCDPNQMLVPLDDHLVHRGDGIFETLSILERRIILLDEHLSRLALSAKKLKISFPCSPIELKEYIVATAQAANISKGNIRILIGRGPGGFDINPSESPKHSLYIAVYSSSPHKEYWYEKGLTACKSQLPAKPNILAQIKTVSCIFGVLASIEALEQNVDLTLSFDDNQCLTEAATANIVIIDNNGNFILPEFQNILVGTILKKTIQLVKNFMPITTRCIKEYELTNAQEVLVVGTTYFCLSITTYEGYSIGTGKTGPIGQKLRTILKQTLLTEGTPF